MVTLLLLLLLLFLALSILMPRAPMHTHASWLARRPTFIRAHIIPIVSFDFMPFAIAILPILCVLLILCAQHQDCDD